nr:MAG TPA: hypothetical protein [Caudoviricetes sp.]
MRSVASARSTSARICSLSESARHLASKSSTVANGIISSGIILPSFWGGLVPDEGQTPAGQYERRRRARLPRRHHRSQGRFRCIRLRASHYDRLRDESQCRGLGACRIAFPKSPLGKILFGWVVFCFFTAILSGASLGLNRRELVRENVPSVQNLKTKSNLVPTLQVTLTVRVTETDDLKRQRTLNSPPDTVDEVADNALDIGGDSSLGLAGNSVSSGSRKAHEVVNVDAEADLRVTRSTRRRPVSILGLEATERPNRGRGKSKAGRRNRLGIVVNEQSGGLTNRLVHLHSADLDTLGGGGQVVGPRVNNSTGQRINTVVKAEVEGTGKRLTALLRKLIEDVKLIVLIGPLHLLVETHSNLSLVRLSGHVTEFTVGGSLLSALVNELGTREIIKSDNVHVAERHGDSAVELGDGGEGLGASNDPVGDLPRHEDLRLA